jgi:hypothetical protein
MGMRVQPVFMTKAQREAAALERLKSKGDDQRKAYALTRPLT